MRSLDTHPAADRVQVDLLRRATVARRASLARSLSRTTRQLAWRAVREANPDADEDTLATRLVAVCYGAALADRLRQHLAARAHTPPS